MPVVNTQSVLPWCTEAESEPFVTEKKVYLKIKLYPSSSRTVKNKTKKTPKKTFLWLSRYSLLDGMFSDSSNQSSDWINPSPPKKSHMLVQTFTAEVYKDRYGEDTEPSFQAPF